MDLRKPCSLKSNLSGTSTRHVDAPQWCGLKSTLWHEHRTTSTVWKIFQFFFQKYFFEKNKSSQKSDLSHPTKFQNDWKLLNCFLRFQITISFLRSYPKNRNTGSALPTYYLYTITCHHAAFARGLQLPNNKSAIYHLVLLVRRRPYPKLRVSESLSIRNSSIDIGARNSESLPQISKSEFVCLIELNLCA